MGLAPLERPAVSQNLALKVAAAFLRFLSPESILHQVVGRRFYLMSLVAFFLSGLVLLSTIISTHAAEASPSSGTVPTRPTFLLVIGAPGDTEYGSNFLRQADLWQKACAKVDCRKVVVGLVSPTIS